MKPRRVLSWSIVFAVALTAAGCRPKAQDKPSGDTPAAKKQEVKEGIQVSYQDEGGHFGVLLTNDLTHDLTNVQASLNWTPATGNSTGQRLTVPLWKSGQQVRACNIAKGDGARAVRLVGSAKTAGADPVALDLYCNFPNPPTTPDVPFDPGAAVRKLTTGFSVTYQSALNPRGPEYVVQVRNDLGADLTNPQIQLKWFRTALNSPWNQAPFGLFVWKAGEVCTFHMDKSDLSRDIVLTGSATMAGRNPVNVQIECPLPDPP